MFEELSIWKEWGPSDGWSHRAERSRTRGYGSHGHPKMTWTAWGNGELPVARNIKTEVFRGC